MSSHQGAITRKGEFMSRSGRGIFADFEKDQKFVEM